MVCCGVATSTTLTACRPPACLPACLDLQGDLDTSARGADEAADLAALQWVPGGEMGGKGLSSGVKKVGRARWLVVLRRLGGCTFGRWGRAARPACDERAPSCRCRACLAPPCPPPSRQVYKLFTDACSKAASKQSITAFFRPKAPAAAAADDAASA